MQELVIDQLVYFLVSFAWGIFLMWIYDGIRVWRRYVKPALFLSGAADILFWCAGAVCIYRMSYYHNYGIIRAYSIAALVAGMCCYHFICSASVYSTTCHILDAFFGKFAPLYNKLRSVIIKVVRLKKSGEKTDETNEQEEKT